MATLPFVFGVRGTIRRFERHLTQRQLDIGSCPECGYDASGLPAPTCPECGKPVSVAARSSDVAQGVQMDFVARRSRT
jgi:predicted amidophosphoribosyltransferase